MYDECILSIYSCKDLLMVVAVVVVIVVAVVVVLGRDARFE